MLTRDGNYVQLTKRELDVLKLIVGGKSTKNVSDILQVSKRTVDFHITQIYGKLNVSNRVQVFRRAIELDLVNKEDITN